MNEIAQTEQKGYCSQCDYRDPVYFSSLLDMGRYRITGPGLRNLCTDHIPGITLKGERRCLRKKSESFLS